MPSKDATATITDHEAEQVKRANAAGRVPVVFVHGLWLLPAAGIGGPSFSRRTDTRR